MSGDGVMKAATVKIVTIAAARVLRSFSEFNTPNFTSARTTIGISKASPKAIRNWVVKE